MQGSKEGVRNKTKKPASIGLIIQEL